MKPSLKKGFSIIELIFVIAVLGIIAAVAVPKLLDSRSSALSTTIKQDISTITNAIQSYYMLNGEIDDISESVTINSNTWNTDGDKTVIFPKTEDGTPCVTINIDNNELKVTLTENNTEVCTKIRESGIEETTYTLY